MSTNTNTSNNTTESGSTTSTSPEAMDTTAPVLPQVGQFTSDPDSELATAASTSLTLEEEVEKEVEIAMMDVGSGSSVTGSSQRTEGNLGPMATPVPDPPVFQSSDIRVKQGKVQPDTNQRVGGTGHAADRVIWSPAPSGPRARSVSSRRERPKPTTPGDSSLSASLSVKPLERLGRPRAKTPLISRSSSSGPVSNLSRWRSRTADNDVEDEADEVDEDVIDDETHPAGPSQSNSAGEAPARYGKDGQRSLGDQLRMRAKRARGRKNLKERKATAKAASDLEKDIKGLKVQVVIGDTVHTATPGGGRKRATNGDSGDPTVLKKSKQETALAKSLADYFSAGGGNLASSGPRTTTFFKNGPIALPVLRQFAHTLHGLHQDTSGGAPLAHPTDALRDSDGLLVLQLDDQPGPTGQTVRQVAVPRAVRSGAEVTPQLNFHSSELFGLAGKIEFADKFQCGKCLSSHWPVPRSPKKVLVTHSEVIAAAGFPSSLTLSSAQQEPVAPTAPAECYDTVWILGGLLSDPARILKALYGSYQGDLIFLIDLGTLAITRGESAFSVRDRLHNLGGFLKRNLRFPGKGETYYTILPPIIHLGDGEVALHQETPKAVSKLALAEMLMLRELVDCQNGSMTAMPSTPMHSWAKLVSARHGNTAFDSLHRTYQEVTVRVTPSTWGVDGVLHLKPSAIHNLVRTVAAFMVTHRGTL